MHTCRSSIISQLRMQPPSSGSQMHWLSAAQVGSSGRSVQVGGSPVSPVPLDSSPPSLEPSLEPSLDALLVVAVVDIVVELLGSVIELLGSVVDSPLVLTPVVLSSSSLGH